MGGSETAPDLKNPVTTQFLWVTGFGNFTYLYIVVNIMSALRKLTKLIKFIVILFIRMQILVLAGWGIYGVITGSWVLGAVGLLVPLVYFGTHIWRGYRDANTGQNDASSTDPDAL